MENVSNNAKQADVLDGATVLMNSNGTAPGHFSADNLMDATALLPLPGPHTK